MKLSGDRTAARAVCTTASVHYAPIDATIQMLSHERYSTSGTARERIPGGLKRVEKPVASPAHLSQKSIPAKNGEPGRREPGSSLACLLKLGKVHLELNSKRLMPIFFSSPLLRTSLVPRFRNSADSPAPAIPGGGVGGGKGGVY